MLIQKGNKWITDADASREFNLRIDALGYQKRLKNRTENHIREEMQRDNRTLSKLINIWYRLHGNVLKDGYPRCKKLLWVANELDNPIGALFSSEVFARYREKRVSEVSTTTINREHAYLRAVFNELKRLGVITYENPLTNIRQFKETEKGLRFLTFDEISTLLKMCERSSNKSLSPVVKICLATGARWSEAEGLKASQVINNKITYLDTKSGKNRTVPISNSLFNELDELGKSGDQRLFIGCINAYRVAIKAAFIQLPKGQLSHVLRHSFASHFIMKGGNIVVLKDILGHSTIETTMRYAHLAPEHLADAVKLNPLENN
ncbi:phage integrase [Psychromonas sp. Urea-02u-13]|uniref:phage integrase n=1 Tax=Psychromonas sp. Urea-02u-13 TaxID=2058326 RepID=UPI000C328001|nr:tyrosine-type recombinase/integrase [Psychromonas sp. Urea-02u-13]PKG39716.1 integrase [Psychromonas sp. Urea-02u-13]